MEGNKTQNRGFSTNWSTLMMREQRLAGSVMDRERQSFQITCTVYRAAHRGLRLPADDPCKQSLSDESGLLVHRAGNHPWVIYDPLSIQSSRRLEKSKVLRVCVSGMRDQFKKHFWKRQGFWILWFTTKICCTLKSASWVEMCLQWVVRKVGLKSEFLFIQGRLA